MGFPMQILEVGAELVKAVNGIDPLGALAGFGILVFWIAVLLIRDRNREREAQTRIALAEQANAKERLDSDREERLGFFESIRDIRDYTSAVRDLVQKTTEKDVKADTRDDAMVQTLNSIADRLVGLGENYTALAISEKTIADDLNTARKLLEKIPVIEDDLKEALKILKRVDLALQMPMSDYGKLSNNDQQEGQK